MDCFESALDNTLEELGEIMLDHMYNLASTTEKQILRSMAENYYEERIDALFPSEKRKTNVPLLLKRLEKKQLIIKSGRENFRLPSRFFAEYVLRK